MDVVEPQLRLFGHRGSSALVPENTIEAFRQALDDGADALELDVHRTADGHFVVAHDPDGQRMAHTGARISDSMLSEVRSWNVGAGFGESDRAGHVIPTLADVIDGFPEVPISIDLKPDDRDAVRPLLELISNHDATDRVTVGSFHDRLVYALRGLGYTGPTALTRGEVAAVRFLPRAFSRFLIRGHAAMIPRSRGPIRLDSSRFIRRCRRLGLRVDYWVVNDPEDARDLLSRGATGIVSDDPGRIEPVMREFRDDRQA
jgi:glycerophosphoryl diester phosphodiesterase